MSPLDWIAPSTAACCRRGAAPPRLLLHSLNPLRDASILPRASPKLVTTLIFLPYYSVALPHCCALSVVYDAVLWKQTKESTGKKPTCSCIDLAARGALARTRAPAPNVGDFGISSFTFFSLSE